jgi:hypothetical protein
MLWKTKARERGENKAQLNNLAIINCWLLSTSISVYFNYEYLLTKALQRKEDMG